MISPSPFDIQKAVQALKQADFTERQAEAITETILSAFTASVATKTALG